jgi:hypothetical protein
LPVREGQPATQMHIAGDPDGKLGLSGLWHAECARPFWDKMTPTLDRLGFWSSGF